MIPTSSGGSFGPAVELSDVTTQVLDGIDDLDATEDPGDGVYALWADFQGEVLDYSANGGATWGPPVVTPTPYASAENMAGIGGGIVEIAYVYNPGTGSQVFLEAVNYQELATPPPTPTTLTTTQTSGTTTGASITIPAGTLGETDKATITGTNASTATGTVDYVLYGNSSCTGTSLISGTATVTGGVAGPVDRHRRTPTGHLLLAGRLRRRHPQPGQRQHLRLRGADRRPRHHARRRRLEHRHDRDRDDHLRGRPVHRHDHDHGRPAGHRRAPHARRSTGTR